MLKDVVEARSLDGRRLFLKFEDGIEGEVDVAEMIRFEGVFAPLAERDYFLRVRVNPEIGTVYWPNEADLDPDVLCSQVTGKEIPHLTGALARN
ncbi:MAG: DUF2442 domain-containing protein [Pirellulales bacterium]|nr:DUF2442 domain-containing protein [Pirellulales bacterium]